MDEDASQMRRMVAESHGVEFRTVDSLRAAHAGDPGFWAILQGDDGGQIYAVFPVELIRCDESVLRKLLAEVDAVYWNDPEMAGLSFEQLQDGSVVPGGMGGGIADPRGWIHPRLISDGLASNVRAVIESG